MLGTEEVVSTSIDIILEAARGCNNLNLRTRNLHYYTLTTELVVHQKLEHLDHTRQTIHSQIMEEDVPLVGLEKSKKSAHELPQKVLASDAKSLRSRIWSRIWIGFLVFFIIILPIGLIFILIFCVTITFNPGCGEIPTISVRLVVPDLTFGSLTVTEARAIDLSWNLIMGRCLPFSMAIIFYKVATGALTRIAERAPVSYRLFATMTLDLHALTTVVPIARSAVTTAGWRAKTTLWFLL
jgi:hypothetical protein